MESLPSFFKLSKVHKSVTPLAVGQICWVITLGVNHSLWYALSIIGLVAPSRLQLIMRLSGASNCLFLDDALLAIGCHYSVIPLARILTTRIQNACSTYSMPISILNAFRQNTASLCQLRQRLLKWLVGSQGEKTLMADIKVLQVPHPISASSFM